MIDQAWSRWATGFVILCCIAVFAHAYSYPPEIVLPDPDSFTVSAFLGEDNEDTVGGTISRAGDLNDDGIEDFVVGSWGAQYYTGRAHVVFGRSGGFAVETVLSSLDGTDGFTIVGIETVDKAGSSVADIGDFNADGIDDLLVGASNAGPGPSGGPGECYIIFGRSTGFPPELRLDSLDGSNGFTLRGKAEQDLCGYGTRAGDFNGDGIDDVLLAAPWADPLGRGRAGECYVVFGTTEPLPARVELATLDGTNGFAIPGLGTGDALGGSLSTAGDVNGDQFDDIIVGALSEPDGSNTTGASYVIFGSDRGFGPSFDLTSLDGTNGFVVPGRLDVDFIQGPVTGGSDVNGDGLDDLLVTATFRRAGSGAYVIFGNTTGFPAYFDVTQLDGTNGFVLRTSYDGLGLQLRSAATGGDVNDDGIDDIVLGGDAPVVVEAVVVVFGRSGSFEAVVEAENLDGKSGFTLFGPQPGERFASAVSTGDVNGDGTDDLLIGAVAAPGLGDDAGEAYVYYGRPDCREGRVNAANGIVLNSLFVNGSMGGADRVVEVSADEFVDVTLLRPIAGGSGKFVVHADEGEPASVLARVLPYKIGATCFPFLLTKGATPVIVANNFGRANLVGSSRFYGTELPDPERATTVVSYPPLPLGLVLTFQGVISDPGSFSVLERASTTNAVTVRIVK